MSVVIAIATAIAEPLRPAWRQGDYGVLVAGAHQRSAEPNLAQTPSVQDQLDVEQNAMLIRFAKETDRTRLRFSIDTTRRAP